MKNSFIVFRITGTAILAVALSGCAPKVWTKPGLTQEDFNNDKYACMQSAAASAPAAVGSTAAWNGGGGSAGWGTNGGGASWNNGGGYARPVDVNARNRTQLFNACMEARGYTLTRAQSD